jgi:hypothetical protein
MRLLTPEMEELARSSSPGDAAMAARLLDLAKTVSIHDQMILSVIEARNAQPLHRS